MLNFCVIIEEGHLPGERRSSDFGNDGRNNTSDRDLRQVIFLRKVKVIVAVKFLAYLCVSGVESDRIGLADINARKILRKTPRISAGLRIIISPKMTTFGSRLR